MNALKIAIVFILVLNGIYSFTNWLNSSAEPDFQHPLQESYRQPPAAAEGLDLPALTALTKKVRSGQELERKLNQAGGINNLDLDDNGKADYLQVDEFGTPAEGKIGYSIFSEPAKNQRQEIAAITIEKNQDNAEIQVVGNPQIYGDDAIYNDFIPIERKEQPPQNQTAPYPTYSSYFMPHPMWLSPFGYGLYPPFFGFYPLIGHSLYASRMGGYRSAVRTGPSRYQRTSTKSIQNPNKGKSASSGIRRSLKKPTSTQKQFAATNKKQQVGKGGFGRNRTLGRTPSQRSQFGSRNSSVSSRRGSSFGGSSSRQGFGRSRARSTSSFRGFGGGSRSFSFGGK